MRAPSRTTVVAATLAGLLGVGAGWLGTARPWQDELMVTEAGDGSGTVQLIATEAHDEVPGGLQQWWTDGRSTLLLAPTDSGFALLPQREVPGGRWEAYVDTTSRVRPVDLAALPGSEDGPWVALGASSAHTVDHTLRSWSGDWAGQSDPDAALPAPTASKVPAAPDPMISGETALHSFVAVATIDGHDLGVTAWHQGSTSGVKNTTRGLAVCPDASACRWGDELEAPGIPVALVSTGTGFVLVVDGMDGVRVLFADDAGLDWQEVGKAPEGMHLARAVDTPEGALLLWGTDGDDGPDELSIQRVSTDGTVEDEVEALPLPVDTYGITSAARVDDRWVVGAGASDGHAWANPGYSPGRARLLRAGDEVWEDVTPEAMRHRLDETVVAMATTVAGKTTFTLASPVQRTASRWRWEPTDPS